MPDEKSVIAVIRAARPSFRSACDRIAFAVHASFLASGYVLIATGTPALSDTALSSASTEEVGDDNWNERDDEYAFVYWNPEKDNKRVLVKCLAMNDKLLVDALNRGGLEPLHLEVNVKEYVATNGGSNYSDQYKDLGKLVKTLDSEILSKLDGSPKPSSSTNPSSSEGSRWVGDSGLFGPDIHPSGVVVPPVHPFDNSDVFPGPGAGIYPRRGDFGDGSMLIGPNDPRWFGGPGSRPDFLGPGGLPGVPPGARFDPYGPPGVPGFEPSRFIRNPQRPHGGNHPDLEHFGSSMHPDLQHFRGGSNSPFGESGSDFI